MSSSFVHLHVHSDYSLMDSSARIPDLYARAAELGMPALALTDHGHMMGAYAFYQASKGTGVKPIIGLEGYLTPKTHRSERKRVQFGDGSGDDVAAKGAYTHLTLWAQNTEGMHNLFRLASRSSLEGFFYKPRADRELLNLYGKGLIGTTGCPSGEVQTYLRQGMYSEAVASAAEFRDIFGAENYYVELMDHGLTIETRVRQDLLRIAKDLNLPLVATNDLHYTNREDADAHDNLLCVSAGANKDTPGRFKFNGDGYYLKSAEEMRALFAELPQACDSTLEIAERCNVDFTEGEGRFMPRFPVPDGHTESSWFVHEVNAGLERRYRGQVPDEVRRQAEYEIGMIEGKGYAGYFLVVADFINWAKEQGIKVGPGYASGAGSVCAYAMRITDLDPLQHGLIFERFLNPEGTSMPDFNLDFDDRHRDEVIQYVSEKYGDDRVSQIVTFERRSPQQAVVDVSTILGTPSGGPDRIIETMPLNSLGQSRPLSRLLDLRQPEGQKLRDLCDADEGARQVVDAARGIELLIHDLYTHEAGLVISSEPLIDVLPIMKRRGDGAILTQFDYRACEALGLVKMDIRGLRILTTLSDALAGVKLSSGVDIDLDELTRSPEDPATYALLSRGDTTGVFQFESAACRQMLREMKPRRFDDIAAVAALLRPGPTDAGWPTEYSLRKNGQRAVRYPDGELVDALQPILGSTYGLVLYQEQVMTIARQLAGLPLAETVSFRRVLSRRKPEDLASMFGTFRIGMLRRGFSAQSVKALWDELVSASSLPFNKAHAAAYGMVSYWSAYLKANHPVEFMAAVSANKEGTQGG